MLLLCLPRKAADQSRSQRRVRKDIPDHGNLIRQILSIRPASHPPQDLIIAVLYRKIQIMAYFRLFFYHLQQSFRNLLGITVHQPNPFYLFYPAELCQEFRQFFFPVQIHAIDRCLLGDHDQLPCAAGSQQFRLAEQLLHRNTPVISPQAWNNTVCTAFAAPFRNLQIRNITRHSRNAFCQILWQIIPVIQQHRAAAGQSPFNCGDDLVISSCPDYGVHFRNFTPYFF